jgi:hypothetical protein
VEQHQRIGSGQERLPLNGAGHDGSVAFRKKLPRGKLVDLFASAPPCLAAMEAAPAHTTGAGNRSTRT